MNFVCTSEYNNVTKLGRFETEYRNVHHNAFITYYISYIYETDNIPQIIFVFHFFFIEKFCEINNRYTINYPVVCQLSQTIIPLQKGALSCHFPRQLLETSRAPDVSPSSIRKLERYVSLKSSDRFLDHIPHINPCHSHSYVAVCKNPVRWNVNEPGSIDTFYRSSIKYPAWPTRNPWNSNRSQPSSARIHTHRTDWKTPITHFSPINYRNFDFLRSKDGCKKWEIAAMFRWRHLESIKWNAMTKQVILPSSLTNQTSWENLLPISLA